MAHSLPKFPITCSIYSGDIALIIANSELQFTPTNTGAPRLTDRPCEVVGHVGIGDSQAFNPVSTGSYFLNQILMYFQRGEDVRDLMNRVTANDTIVTEDGWVFIVTQTFPIAHGFENEFLGAMVIPYTVGSPPPP